MNSHAAVSLRERVKLPPSQTMIDSYYRPTLEITRNIHLDTEIWVHLAHAQMLARQQIIGQQDAERIQAALLELQQAGTEALNIDFALEDLYSYTERWLTNRLGPEIGGRLHTGRSRNDLHVTTWRMTLRESMLKVLAALNDMRAATLELAARTAETVMPGYTHWQHAQPVTLGYYLLAFSDVLARDYARCVAAFHRSNMSPLGSGALTTTAFPLDRESTQTALGFEGLVEIAYDGVASRDDAHEATAAMAIMMTNLTRLATDLQAWSTMEYHFIELGDQHSSVSSIMPQKKNPACLEHIKGAAAQVTGFLTATLSSSKNTAYADVSDGVSAVNEPALNAAIKTQRILRLFADVLRNITVFPERMRHFAEIGFGTATELADVIVRETGLSFRMAHNVVATVVSEALGAGKTANQITSADLDRAAQTLFGRTLGVSDDAVLAALDPVENVRRRSVTGGPAPQNMRSMQAAREASLKRAVSDIAAFGAQLEAARAQVFAQAKTASPAPA